MKKRLLACLLTAAMLVSLLPLHALAAEVEPDSGGLCPHHQEHSFEDCDFIESVEGQPCGYVCPICRARDALAALDGQAENEPPTPLAYTVDTRYQKPVFVGGKLTGFEPASENATVVTATDAETGWSTGWYVASGNVEILSRVTVTGDVHLILEDGCSLTVNDGIQVQGDGNSLTIYGQESGTGELTAASSSDAGIGGNSRGGTGGTITINGGTVTASGGGGSAGIGGGTGALQTSAGAGGTITINGGTVTATGGGDGGAGIGGGSGKGSRMGAQGGDGGTITINGGTVVATSAGAAGIGGGNGGYAEGGSEDGGNGGAITISGGNVTANGGEGGAGIGGAGGVSGGGGRYGTAGGAGGTITISGGTVRATGSALSNGVGAGIGGGAGSNGAGESGSFGGTGGSGGEITITGGTVAAASGRDGYPDIGGGRGGNGYAGGQKPVAPADKIEIGPGAAVTNGSGGKPNYSPAHGMDSSRWASDEKEHWHPCKLEGCKDVAHIYELESHTVDTQHWAKDNDQHWHGCTVCGEARQDIGDHAWDAGSICSGCQAVRAAAPNVTIDYAAETLSTTGEMEYSNDNGVSWTACSTDMDARDLGWSGSAVTVLLRTAGTAGYCASVSVSVAIPARPEKPSSVQAEVATTGNDGRITGVNNTMEYRKDSEGTWTPCTGTEVTGLAAGSYLVRYKATATSFASQDAEVNLHGPAPEQGLCLNDGTIDIYENNDGGIVAEQNGTEYTASNGEILITGNGKSTSNRIVVDSATTHITLSNVKAGGMDTIEIYYSNVRLTLEGNNTIILEEYGGNAISATEASLTIDGPGTLTIECGYGSSGIFIFYDADVTINGGVLNISAEYPAAIRSYDSGRLTVNGGTVELTGPGNQIDLSYGNGNSVTVTGGSVTAGGITPAPTNGTDPVYAVTVEGMDSGAVGDLLLKKDGAVYPYGLPARTTADGKLTLYLPESEYSGMAVVDGRLVSFTCTANSGAETQSTATDMGIQITTPEGEAPTINVEGTVDVPGGSTVQTGDGPEITVGGKGGTVGGDGSITVPEGGVITTGDITVTLPDGGTMSGDGDGKITVPEGGAVQIGSPATTITPPSGGAAALNPDGTVTVPEGSTVKPGNGGPEITVGPGNSGAVGGDGGVTVLAGGKVQVSDSTITLPAGGAVKPNPDGSIPLPGGAMVEKGGQVIVIPDGGGIYHPEDGTVTENVCTVTFDSLGGSAVSPIVVLRGEKVTKPGNPVRSGYTFDGWYRENSFTTAWDFEADTVTGNITLYAKWTETSDPGGNPGGNPGGSSGGGGGYTPPSTPTYPPTVEKPGEGGGAPAVTPSNPKLGDTVTVKPRPDSGYEVDKITVTDKNGKPVEVTVKPDGTYTFKQPGGKVTIVVTYKPVETPWNNPFADVSEGDWYYEAVRFVQERGLMNGYGGGNFAPNAQLSRAQLAQILFNKEGRPGVNYLLTFPDVASEAWYTEAIRWATSQSIVGGYGNGTFGPNDPITREQLAVMLWRYSGSPTATNKELHFNDTDEISGFALEALRWAVENGILNGYGDGRLGPQGQATRAQVAQMLKNFIENQEETT